MRWQNWIFTKLGETKFLLYVHHHRKRQFYWKKVKLPVGKICENQPYIYIYIYILGCFFRPSLFQIPTANSPLEDWRNKFSVTKDRKLICLSETSKIFPEILQVLFFHQNLPAVSSPSGFEKVRGEKSTLISIYKFCSSVCLCLTKYRRIKILTWVIPIKVKDKKKLVKCL